MKTFRNTPNHTRQVIWTLVVHASIAPSMHPIKHPPPLASFEDPRSFKSKQARYPVSQCKTPVDDHLLSCLAGSFFCTDTNSFANLNPASHHHQQLHPSSSSVNTTPSAPFIVLSPMIFVYFRLNEQPSVNRAFPPVGWHNTVEQPPQMTTVWACEKTVVMVKQPGHLTSMKKERGAGTSV